MIFVIIRLITQLINQLRKKEIIWFLSKQIILQCARILRSNCPLIIKSTKNYRPGGTYWDCGDFPFNKNEIRSGKYPPLLKIMSKVNTT